MTAQLAYRYGVELVGRKTTSGRLLAPTFCLLRKAFYSSKVHGNAIDSLATRSVSYGDRQY
jgi:hypothetical protein